MSFRRTRLRTHVHSLPRHTILGLLLMFLSLLMLACAATASHHLDVVVYVLPPGLRAVVFDMADVIRPVFLAVGGALLVLGWKLDRLLIAFPGFVFGAGVGFLIGHVLSGEEWAAYVAALIGAAVGVVLALKLADVAVFGAGGLGGAILTIVAYGYLTHELLLPPPLLLVAGGVVGGILLLAIHHRAIVVATSAVGAVLVGAALDVGINRIVWMAALWAGGIAVQYGVARILGERVLGKETEA